MLTEWKNKDKLLRGKYLQITYLTIHLYSECIKNSQNSTIKEITQFLKMDKRFEETIHIIKTNTPS